MSKTALFCANGFEECEGLLVVDLLRRANIEISMVSIEESKEITSSHKVKLTCDQLFDEVDFDSLDMIILPGGMPGTNYLKAHEGLKQQILKFDRQGKWLAAICAAPSVYGQLGLLNGKTFTCFPGFEDQCEGGSYTGEKVEVDGHFITARGLGAAIEFGSKIIEVLDSKEKADDTLSRIQY